LSAILVGPSLREASSPYREALVADATPVRELPADRFKRWLLQERVEEVQGPEAKEGQEQHTWWQIVCLTGVD
jgi:hypothetical protein